jgi:class 3 adenylate cyclase
VDSVPATRYVKTLDGGYVAFKLLGDEGPDVAIVGSIATNIELILEFDPAARSWFALSAHSRVTMHDRRGTGLSDDMGGLPNLETRAADLLAVLDAAEQERPVLLAAGDGGMVAAMLAATHPDRVGGLVWAGAQARSVETPDWPHGRPAADVEQLAEAAERGWGSSEFVRRMYPAIMDEQVAEYLARLQRHACGPATAVRFIRLLHEYDVRDILPTLRLPVLALAARRSPADRIYQQAAATAQLIPGATLHALPPEAYSLWHPSVIDAATAFLGIEPDAPELDTVLATVLFSDIVQSTAQQAQLGDHRWKHLVEGHHAVVRRALGRWRGVENDTAGDGFYATFDGPARAIRCGLQIIDEVRALGLEVRVGIHTGECELVDGKCAGIAVSTGARIAALAQPSQVLISQTVKDLVAGSELTFQDAGEHELKGVPNRRRLHAATQVPTAR